MATAYVAPTYSARNGRAQIAAGQWVTQYGAFTFPAAPVVNDTVLMLPIPKGFRVLHGILKSTDLDTGTATITLSVGDSAAANNYWAASTIAQAGGATSLSGSRLSYKYTADDVLKLLVAAGPATGVVGTVELFISGCFD